MKTWFTSDTHFGHQNIIKYCNRPFKDVDHMNEVLIKNWNSIVDPDDTIYHLGDFAMGPKDRWPSYIKRLNGMKLLVRGNHDQDEQKMKDLGFTYVFDNMIVPYKNFDIYLSHFPHPEFVDAIPKGQGPTKTTKYQFCGHVHTDWKTYEGVIVNVGVNQWDYKPITVEQALGALDDNKNGNIFTLP